jgi:hypothetical protein
MGSKAKMAGVRLEEIELMEAWSEENDEVRARFDFPLTRCRPSRRRRWWLSPR